ncbi:MAG: L-threonylcarbamoyladenylate synthase [Myxococcota bacterium]|nr:L-threonylcarbamoyladenylate synthase [Myxococcota bacterium]MDW8363443.1 L-threonylcarbamoyladenylate synthase [Myxococcales bacterium]
MAGQDALIAQAVEVLRRGGVVACPTETLVGLLVDARDESAVARLCAIKGRPEATPIALIVPDANWAGRVIELDEYASALAQRHWPGPLTLVGRARGRWPAPITRQGTVGVRVPGPSPAALLVRAFDGPLTATSANRSGAPPARDEREARAALGDEVDFYVPGASPGGPPSTVLDVTVWPPRLVRAGAVDVPEAVPSVPRSTDEGPR